MRFISSSFVLLIATVAASASGAVTGQWIWTDSASVGNERAWFRKEFSLSAAQIEKMKFARLHVTCDNHAIVFLNGKQIARIDEWRQPKAVDAAKALRAGKNVLAVEAWNDDGPAGLFLCLQITGDDKKPLNVATDKTWNFSRERVDVERIDNSSTKFQPAKVVATFGQGPWGNVFGGSSSVAGSKFSTTATDGPVLLDDRFELPPGFHIYRVATRELSGGSYAMAIDGQGRLLVGDGTAIRRLTDSDGDHVYDKAEAIADGLGGRGPQGILIRGDLVYAVGGDGLQLYSGYKAGGPLKHEGRLGHSFPTGGDHAAHMLVRGLDDWIYFITGDGAGNSAKHVNMPGSPVVNVRGASVYRSAPTGQYWEGIGSGGRNAPGMGMNYLGEFFTFDSDLEYTYEVPNYVPTRLIHWATGIQDGWAWNEPAGWRHHFPDLQPPVLSVGRGTPTMGTIYEHTQFPQRYRDAYLCCDYLWKDQRNIHARTTGRVVAFHLERNGAGFEAKMTVLIDGKPNAKGAGGRRINFAAVDCIVAADGSLLVSDHNQGVWRVFYDESETPEIPQLLPARPTPAGGQRELLKQIVRLPQPGSEYTRVLQDELLASLPDAERAMRDAVLDGDLPLRDRLRALRIVAPQFAKLPVDWLKALAGDTSAELRGQAAWLYGLRRKADEISAVLTLVDDKDPFVRRRACEALARLSATEEAIVASAAPLVERLNDSDPRVRYAAMIALAHIPQEHWIDPALASEHPQTQIRAVLAARWVNRNYRNEWATGVVNRLVDRKLSTEDRLALYRLISLHAGSFTQNAKFADHILADFPSANDDVRWEQFRLIGQLQIAAAAPRLAKHLPDEKHPVARLVLLDSLARLPVADKADARRVVEWLVDAQKTDFNDFSNKGPHYPGYVRSVCQRLSDRSPNEFAAAVDQVVAGSFLAESVYRAVAASGEAGVKLALERFAALQDDDAQVQIIEAIRDSKLSPQQVTALIRALRASDHARLHQTVTPLILRQKLALEKLGDETRQQAVIDDLLQMTLQSSRSSGSGNRILSSLTGAAAKGLGNKDSLNPDEQVTAAEHWFAWYRRAYGRPFSAKLPQRKATLTDKQIHELLLTDKGQGDPRRGRAIYLKTQCIACHGRSGEDKQATIFGHTLTGIAQRLKPEELADALVYPSKKVDDRFRMTSVVTIDGKVITGFLTQQGDDEITLLAPEGKRNNIQHEQIGELAPHRRSLMREGRVRYIEPREISDLLAYLR